MRDNAEHQLSSIVTLKDEENYHQEKTSIIGNYHFSDSCRWFVLYSPKFLFRSADEIGSQ